MTRYMRGVSDIFVTTDVYEAYLPAADSRILFRGQVVKGMTANDPPADYKKHRSTDGVEQGINDPMMPIAWSREVPVQKDLATVPGTVDSGKKNRTFWHHLMGASNDLQNEGLRRMIVNSVYWGLGLDVPAKADVELRRSLSSEHVWLRRRTGKA